MTDTQTCKCRAHFLINVIAHKNTSRATIKENVLINMTNSCLWKIKHFRNLHIFMHSSNEKSLVEIRIMVMKIIEFTQLTEKRCKQQRK